jgi:glutamate racemase
LALSNHSQAPIGIFDSGVGGLSVLRHIQQQLPHEQLHYFADSGFAPYGEKSEQEIAERVKYIAEYFVTRGVKALVVACNAATAVAIKTVRALYPELILVGVEPGLKPAASLSQTQCVGVLTTQRTLSSDKYQTLCQRIQEATGVQFIHQACPGLAAQIENGEWDGTHTTNLLRGFLQPIVNSDADIIVLGCTHYPFVSKNIHDLLQQANKSHLQLLETGPAIARHLHTLLEQHRCLNPDQTQPILYCTTSGNITILQTALTKLLHLPRERYVICS